MHPGSSPDRNLSKIEGDMSKIIMFFQVFLVFGVAEFVKSMQSGYSLDAELTHHHVFSGISCFWGSGVRQKYAEWVLVGCGI